MCLGESLSIHCEQFDSFIKTSLSNECNTIKERMRRNSEREILVPDMALCEASFRANNTTYVPFSEHLYCHGRQFIIESEAIYDALIQLPEDELIVILLDFWDKWPQEQIAKQLDVTIRTVGNRKKRAIEKLAVRLRRHLGGGRDP